MHHTYLPLTYDKYGTYYIQKKSVYPTMTHFVLIKFLRVFAKIFITQLVIFGISNRDV